MTNESRRFDEVSVVEIAMRERAEAEAKELYDRLTQLTWKEIDEDYVPLDEATELLGLKRTNYLRQLVLSDRLDAVKVEMIGFDKWFVSLKSVYYYKKHRRRRRSIRRYVLRCNPDDEDEIRSALDKLVEEETISDYTLELAYKGRD